MTTFNHQQVRAILARLSKTQEEFARDIGVGVNTVHRWLRGKHIPLKVYQKKMEEILNEYEVKEELEKEADKENNSAAS